MSTTLMPPTYFEFTPHGGTRRRYRTIADAAAAVVRLAPISGGVVAVTGERTRSLSTAELRELGRHVRRARLLRKSTDRD